MEIGRRKLTDSEFSSLWSVLYQELYKLANTKECDASLVYNTIYIICTANSGLEEKLYWRIGDFLYNQCREHKDIVVKSNNYLECYAYRFKEYELLVESVHSLGSFLNDCSKGRKLDDFGFLLWERMVIQNLTESFFTDVYYLKEEYKLVILNSLKRIVPEISNPLLYYKEKYEKVAIAKIKAKYSKFNYLSMDQFCSNIKKIIEDEKRQMQSSFLSCSFNDVLLCLEDSLFAANYYEILFNCIEFFNVFNLHNIKECKRLISYRKSQGLENKQKPQHSNLNTVGEQNFLSDEPPHFILNNCKNNGEVSFHPSSTSFEVSESLKESMGTIGIRSEPSLLHNLDSINTNIYDVIHSSLLNIENPFREKAGDQPINFHIHPVPKCSLSSQVYYTLNEEEEEKVRLFIEDQTKNSKYLALVHSAVSKKFSADDRKCDYPIPEKSEFREVLDSLSCLNAGFIMLKRAYSLYIESVIKSNLDILESSVENVFLFFKSLYIFNDQDFLNILVTLFREYLLRTKPCFLKRLCDFTSSICNSKEQGSPFSSQRPFETSEIEIFKVSVKLLLDKREFLNMYHGCVKHRLLSNNTDVSKEKLILNSIALSENEKISEIVKEYVRSDKQIKIYNSAYWNIEPENYHIPITHELKYELNRRIKNLVITKCEQKKNEEKPDHQNNFEGCGNLEESYKSLSENLREIDASITTNIIANRPRFTDSFSNLTIENQSQAASSLQSSYFTSKNAETYSSQGIYNNEINLLESAEKYQHSRVHDYLERDGYEIKLKTSNSDLNTVRLAHQHSKVNLLISKHKVTLNYYQYLVFTLVYVYDMQFDQLAEATKLSHTLLRAAVNSLIKSSIIKQNKNVYTLDCSNLVSCDISWMEASNETNNDVCYDSYSQALISKILKRKKNMALSSLKKEFTELSKISIEEDQYKSALSKLCDKGILCENGDTVEFIF